MDALFIVQTSREEKKHCYLSATYIFTFTFTFMHLADAFIQSDLQLGLCDMDKKYVSRFFFSISILITILTQTDMLYLTHLTCFCTSYLFLHFSLFYYTFYSLFFFFTYICSCVVLLLYNFYSLHCPRSGPDLIYISLLIIPCIIYHVTNKETLTFTVISKGIN